MSRLHSEWESLKDIGQLEELDNRSFKQPVVIFKHSTRCGVSTFAERRLYDGWGSMPKDILLYHLDLLAYRSISNTIADKYNVTHQSPQILVIKNGEATADCSHDGVGTDFLLKALSLGVEAR